MPSIILHQNSNKIKRLAKQLIINNDITYKSIKPFWSELDIHLIQKNSSSIGIEDIKKLLRDLQYKPISHEKQFGVILNAYLLTIEAQNVLLKSLEEPSKYTDFILGTRSLTDLLPTIRSRCAVYHVSETTDQEHIPEECRDFMNMKKYERFIFINEYLKEHKKKEETGEFILGLIEIERENVTKVSTNSASNMKLLNEAYRYWSANVNKQLLLEYIAINLIDHN